MIATPSVELLTCQPYAGVKTSIQDLGLGQGLNVVFGLADQFGLKEGTKVACDNLFTNFYLLNHFTDRGLGVVGTVRQNRLVGVPLRRTTSPTDQGLPDCPRRRVASRADLGLPRTSSSSPMKMECQRPSY